MKEISIPYSEFKRLADLPPEDSALVGAACDAAQNAYAPYSGFRVGCALRLDTGEIITGNNQENAAYPSGLCAERTALFYTSANFPGSRVETLAIASFMEGEPGSNPVFPCGACRQVMLEVENRQQSPIRLVFFGQAKVMVFRSVRDILPFAFDRSFLERK